MGFIIGIIWLILVFVVSSLAKGKGRSYGGFFALAFFLSPLIGFIILAIMGENKEVLQQQNIEAGIIKKCPFCANNIKTEAIVCQFCGRDLPNDISIENKTIIINSDDKKEGDIFTVMEKCDLKNSSAITGDKIGIINKGDSVKFITIDEYYPKIYFIETGSGQKGYCDSSVLTKKE